MKDSLVLQPEKRNDAVTGLWWITLPFLMSEIGLAYCIHAYLPVSINWLKPGIVVFAILFSMELSFITEKKIIVLFPIALLFLFYQPMAIFKGFCGMVNLLLQIWNSIYKTAFAQMSIGWSSSDMEATVSFFLLFAGYMLFYSIRNERHLFQDGFLIVISVLMLTFHIFSPLGISFMISSRLCIVFFNHKLAVPKRRIMGMILFCMLICLSSLSRGDVSSVTDLRNATMEKIHDLRYGENVLPRGDLYKASMLQSSDEEMIEIQTAQEKNLYLRGFVGSQYRNGKWKELNAESYAGKNAGMLSWLKENSFDPLYQVSRYYNLCSKQDQPQKNTLDVSVRNASREFFYTTEGIRYADCKDLREDADQRFRSNALFPSRDYMETEMSFAKPNELMIAADWVSNPSTSKQKQYVKAESVYRTFVYDTYAVADTQLYPLLNEIFWNDYDAENDGIYSSVVHVRNCLEKIICEKEIENSNEDPLILFLNGKIKGNDMFYATAAVEALRAHGLAARYVEGYYISSGQIHESKDGTVSLTGKNQHAWIEIYFDGIGWLSVDVTPGYYYDPVKLTDMVSLPDAVHKTAMFEKDRMEPEKFSESSQNDQENGFRELLKKENIPLLITGAVGILCILLTLFWLIAEGTRIWMQVVMKRKYDNASVYEKCQILEKVLTVAMEILGVAHVLGFNSEQTDLILSKKVDGIGEGQYLEVKELLERVIYGGEELKDYEMRTVEYFFSCIHRSGNLFSRKEKLRKWESAFVLYQKIVTCRSN